MLPPERRRGIEMIQIRQQRDDRHNSTDSQQMEMGRRRKEAVDTDGFLWDLLLGDVSFIMPVFNYLHVIAPLCLHTKSC